LIWVYVVVRVIVLTLLLDGAVQTHLIEHWLNLF